VKLLLDSCMSPRDAEALQAAGHDAVWAGSWPEDPGDPEVLRQAFHGDRVLVTLDKGFGALVYVRQMRHVGVISIRNISPLLYVEEILRAIATFERELESGAMVVIGPSGMRMRPRRAEDA
jgi:predicted nuclease of predicted toxin-antitoxin system